MRIFLAVLIVVFVIPMLWLWVDEKRQAKEEREGRGRYDG